MAMIDDKLRLELLALAERWEDATSDRTEYDEGRAAGYESAAGELREFLAHGLAGFPEDTSLADEIFGART